MSQYAERGWHAVQLHGLRRGTTACTCKRGAACGRSTGKHPVDDGWQAGDKSADQVLDDLQRRSWAHNIGIVTGSASGLAVLDVDPDNGGDASLEALLAEHGPLPTTYTVRTGSGGSHYYFALPATPLRNTAGRIANGLDTRGEGGQVVAPPSVSGKGAYTVVLDAPVAEMPAWLLERLTTPARPVAPATTTGPVSDAWTESARAGCLARLDAMRGAATPTGQGYAGEEWDATTYAVACRLVELSNGNPAVYPLDRARADLLEHAPTDAGFDSARVEEKWASARTTVGDKAAAPAARIGEDWSTPDVGAARVVEPGPWEHGKEVHRLQARFAYRLAKRYAGRLMYVHGIGWHAWDGKRWAEDTKGASIRAVLALLRSALAESLHDHDLREEVRKCEGSTPIKGILEIASNLEPLRLAVEDLDADPYLLNVANGTLDLRTMTLRPHDPADRITKVTRAAYRPGEAGGDLWPAFLARVLPDVEVRAYLQRVAGVALLGKVREHLLAIMTGTGANGKGVTYGALLYALGDYAAPAEPELFTSKEGAHPVGQMDLFGRRLVVVSEMDKGRRLAEATMKRLTGGDVIKARGMGKPFVEFQPSHTALLVTNDLPKVSGDDAAIWRRIRVIPFDVVIPEAERDGTLGERLELEADAVLAWAVAGYADYAERGMAPPDAVLTRTSAYRLDSDAVSRFVEERCVTGPAQKATTAVLFDAWEAWARLDGAETLSSKAFGQALDARGYPAGKPSNGKRWRDGIAPDGLDDDAVDVDMAPF